MADLIPSTLCAACKTIFGPDNIKTELGEVEHHGLEALATRATRGCHLCLTVYMTIDPDAYKEFRKGSAADSIGFASISPIARDQAKLKFRYVKAVGGPTMNGGLDLNLSTNASKSSLGLREPEAPLVVEMILMNPKYAVEPGVRNINPNSVTTGSDESFEVARRWIEDCSFSHMKCTISEPNASWKPTHLLDVTVKGPKGLPGIKLIDGVFVDPLSEYVTLSHCWGKSKSIRLHKNNLAAFRQGVAITNLPKTFADAALATSKLGFRYLWIDALCIMHDNEQAVLKDICEMHRVYSEASLNIAATSSREDAMGMFNTRNVLALQPCVVDVRRQGIDDGLYKCLRSTVWRDLVDSSPLSRRAWVFQERCLAKRTLHFTRNELLWECQQMCCSEVFPKGLPATMSASTVSDSFQPFNKRTHHQRHGNWSHLVHMFTRGKLTYNSDKLLAIAGLAKQYMARNRLREQDYLAGLWRSYLPHALLWRVEYGRRAVKYRAPSWSWASVEGQITCPDQALSLKQACVEVMDVEMKHKEDRFGPVESGRLKIRGFLARGLLPRTHEYWGQTPCLIQSMKTQIWIDSATFDDRLPKLSEVSGMLTEQLEIYLLPIIDMIDRVEGLILCASMKKGDFRRIGIFKVLRQNQATWDQFRTIMKGDPNMHNYEERLDHTGVQWFASDYTYTINLI